MNRTLDISMTNNNALSLVSNLRYSTINKRKFKRIIRRNIKFIKIILFSIIAMIVLAAFLSIRVQASNGTEPTKYKYYTTIIIEDGDTLWNIATNNKDTRSYDSYISEVISINNLNSDRLVAGNKLVIPYYSTTYIE